MSFKNLLNQTSSPGAYVVPCGILNEAALHSMAMDELLNCVVPGVMSESLSKPMYDVVHPR